VGRIFRRFDAQRVLPGAFVDATRTAAAVVESARAQASALLESAEAAAERAAKGRIDEAETRAVALLADAARESARMQTVTEAQLVELALAVTARVVAQASAIDPALVKAEASRAIASLARARTLTLACHEADRAALEALTVDDARITIEHDATLMRGEVVVRSDIGRADARLAVRLENVARALGRHT
jgi:flagellar biosynthesis/type III secretory pathway protein FliH